MRYASCCKKLHNNPKMTVINSNWLAFLVHRPKQFHRFCPKVKHHVSKNMSRTTIVFDDKLRPTLLGTQKSDGVVESLPTVKDDDSNKGWRLMLSLWHDNLSFGESNMPGSARAHLDLFCGQVNTRNAQRHAQRHTQLAAESNGGHRWLWLC